MEKIIFENDYEKHIELPNGSVRIIYKKGIKQSPRRDYKCWIGQRWWRQELKDLNPTARAILISWRMIGAKYPKPSERFISRELGISRNTTSKYIKKLRKVGLL